MTTGQKLRQLRKTMHWNQDDLGERMGGVTKGMISQWENDQGKPPIERLMLLHQHVDFSFDWLLLDERVYSTKDPKLVSILLALEPQAEYVKDAATSAVLTTCKLAESVKKNGTNG